MWSKKNLIGQKFGRLTVIEQSKNDRLGNRQWLCKCDCGNTKIIRTHDLKTGKVQSCGCLRLERLKKALTKHGQSDTKLHQVYFKMKGRCYNPKDKNYKDYGGRGIKVCDEWKNDFISFYQWAINNGYKEGLTIDRIDNNGNYETSNCKWATMKEQCRHRRNTRWIEYNGRIQCIETWAEEYNMSRKALDYRLRAGWSIEKALTTPIQQRNK